MKRLLAIKITLLSLAVLFGVSLANSGPTVAKIPNKWGTVSGINYACHQGSDKHCKETLGEEYCCASYRSLAQAKPVYAYICTKLEIILEDGG